MKHHTFESWKQEVDKQVQSLCGLGADDIDDWRYFDDYQDGFSPKQTAKRAVKNAMDA